VSWSGLSGSCGAFSGERIIPNSASQSGAAAVEYFEGRVRTLMVAYRDSSGNIVSRKSTDAVNWTAASAPITSGNIGTPTLVRDWGNNDVLLYAVKGDAVLRKWTYNPAAQQWSSGDGVNQTWDTGGNVQSAWEVPVVLGYVDNSHSTAGLFAAPTNGAGRVFIARRITGDIWTNVGGDTNMDAKAKPGLAYVPTTNYIGDGRLYVSATNFGDKLYVAWNAGNCTTGCIGKEITTWNLVQQGYNDYDGFSGETHLSFDLLRDTNLRAVADHYGQIWYMPLADGIVNYQEWRDIDEYSILNTNVNCRISTGTCKTCIAIDSATGKCTAFQ
jgi:hypothetical protein